TCRLARRERAGSRSTYGRIPKPSLPLKRGDRSIQRAARELVACDSDALIGECIGDDLPRLSGIAEHRIRRDHDIVEKHFVDVAVAQQAGYRTHGDSGRRHGDQENTDSLLVVSTGSGKEEAVLRETRVRSPDLRSIDDILVAAALSASAQRGKIRA